MERSAQRPIRCDFARCQHRFAPTLSRGLRRFFLLPASCGNCPPVENSPPQAFRVSPSSHSFGYEFHNIFCKAFYKEASHYLFLMGPMENSPPQALRVSHRAKSLFL